MFDYSGQQRDNRRRLGRQARPYSESFVVTPTQLGAPVVPAERRRSRLRVANFLLRRQREARARRANRGRQTAAPVRTSAVPTGAPF
jgi:hypothetical protein